MNDIVGPLEMPDILMYCEDLSNEIRALEERTFLSRSKPCALVRTFEEYPKGGIPRERVGLIASFLEKTPQEKWWVNIIHFTKSFECYALWQHAILRKLNSFQFAEYGDASIKDFWFLTAVSLVRGRVLFRGGWFPTARLRTVRSVQKKHAWVFGDNAFMELRNLSEMFEGKRMTAIEIDMQLTQLLVAAAIQNNRLKRSDDISVLLTGD